MKTILFLLFLLMLPTVMAKGLTFLVEQEELYFLVGEQASFVLFVDNSYDKAISGMATYTFTHEVNQGGTSFTNTDTQTQDFTFPFGEHDIGLDLGTSNEPLDLHIDIKFNFEEKGEQEVKLENIIVHFVPDPSEKQENGGKQESSSKSTESLSEKIKRMLEEGKEEEKPSQQTQQQQKLQNSQLSQDTNALKNQLQKQMEQQNQAEKEFEQKIQENEEFKKEQQELLNEGYKLEESEVNPSSNETGDFEMDYKNEQGETASLKGEMENGGIKNLQKEKSADKELQELLDNNEQFQKMQNKLKNQSYEHQQTTFSEQGNTTVAKLNYTNGNKSAQIIAHIENKTVTKIELEKSKSFNYSLIPLVVVLVLLSVILYRKKVKVEVVEEKKVEEVFDYSDQAKKMLKESEKLFGDKKYKDAYGRAGQSLRLFLSHKYGLKVEITNDMLINFLKEKGKSYQEIKECSDLCSLVEFAKYQANIEDFSKIVSIVRKNIE